MVNGILNLRTLRATSATLYLALYLGMCRAKMKKYAPTALYFTLPKCYSSFSQIKSYCSSSLNKKILTSPFFELFFSSLHFHNSFLSLPFFPFSFLPFSPTLSPLSSVEAPAAAPFLSQIIAQLAILSPFPSPSQKNLSPQTHFLAISSKPNQYPSRSGLVLPFPVWSCSFDLGLGLAWWLTAPISA